MSDSVDSGQGAASVDHALVTTLYGRLYACGCHPFVADSPLLRGDLVVLGDDNHVRKWRAGDTANCLAVYMGRDDETRTMMLLTVLLFG